MSGSSAGYHSSHSIPSFCSNLVSPVGQDAKTGQESACPVPDSPISPRPPSQISGSQHSQQSGYETDQTGLAGYFSTSLPPRSLSAGQSSLGVTGNGRSNQRSRYTNGEYKPTLTSSLRPRQMGYNTYDTRYTGLTSPRFDAESGNYHLQSGSSLPRYYRRRTHSNPSKLGGRMQQFSASFDHLEYKPPHKPGAGPASHGSHVTPTNMTAPRPAMSLSNMHSGVPQHSHV